MPLQTGFRVTGPKIVHEVFDDEVVIINLETGTYYTVAGVAADIWTRINGTTAKEIIDGLTDQYEAQAHEVEPAVVRFLNELQSEGLIIADETAGHKAGERSGGVREHEWNTAASRRRFSGNTTTCRNCCSTTRSMISMTPAGPSPSQRSPLEK